MNTYQGRSMALMMALGTILFFGIGGAMLITWVQDRDLATVMTVKSSIWQQLLIGAGFGTLVGFVAKFIVSRDSMRDISSRYARLVGELQTTRSDRILISICAGIGEEIFFRGAVQYWLGIPITAIVFVAIHGYLDPRNRRIMLYGLFMTVIMIIFGFAAEEYGLWGPIIAHTVIDIVLLEYLHAYNLRSQKMNNPGTDTR